MAIEILKYATKDRGIPIDEWLAGLRDQRAKARILIRLDRLELGLEGQWRSVGDNVRELKISEGKGYRVYYAWDGQTIVVLLCGGDKSTQSTDISKAKAFWKDYNERK
ncbi:MAG: type II toxin-antitoxin system RelE/ParE family toxin [Candidatus Thiodiazotropha sp. (ex Epidulcina cf. delphinae)]|nr:type II toxin-antitoxin system RelE/ParE family toxin [Candidatus Thiodiazotropha sp. (ex Epidulcina cf. delphinae)]